jgi:hypothetical protein
MKKIVFVAVALVLVAVLAFAFTPSSNSFYNAPINGEVVYSHVANSAESDQDCFDEVGLVCLTRGAGGPVYNVGDGDIKVGWGACENVEEWHTFDKDGWKKIKSNFGGAMSKLKDKELCFKSTDVGSWDIVFSNYKGGSTSGTFGYVRTKYA